MQDTEKKIYYLLKDLGVRPELEGYKYIKDALLLLIEEEGNLKITKQVYPMVAEKFGVTPQSVERNIRHCIQDVCINTPVETLYNILGTGSRPNEVWYTNSNFLARLYEYFKYEYEG